MVLRILHLFSYVHYDYIFSRDDRQLLVHYVYNYYTAILVNMFSLKHYCLGPWQFTNDNICFFLESKLTITR